MARTEVGDLLFRGRPLRGLAVAGCFSRRRCSVVFVSYRVHQFKPNPISRTQQNSDTSAEITVRSGSERFDSIQQNIGVQNGVCGHVWHANRLDSIYMAAWGATKQSKALTQPGTFPKASVVTFASENMRESAAMRKNVRENCRVLIVRVCDEWGRRILSRVC
jgi:hypothetical protein